METILLGFSDAFTIMNIIYLFIGISMGILVGAVPGLSGPMAIAIAIPITFYMDPLLAIAFLIGINKGGTFGGSIAAILINTPGSPEAMATTFDGYPLAQKGKAIRALKCALYSSVTGDTFSDIVLILVAAPIASVALKMGPPEVLSVIVLALALISALETKSMLKGLIGAALGILISCIGIDPVSATPRLTFGIMDLQSGLGVIPVGIGLLALSEIWVQVSKSANKEPSVTFTVSKKKEDNAFTLRDYLSLWKTLLRSSLIGTALGALPGLGVTIAAFLGYGAAKKASKNPEEFGKGSLEGIAAAEAANNAVVGSNMIPLFTLGIPGNLVAALLIGAFIIHGVQPGPMMFEEHGRMIYGIYGAMLIANFLNLIIGRFGLRLFAKALSAPRSVIYPLVIFICVTGTYIAESRLFALYIMIGFAVIGFLFRIMKISVVTLIIGNILGPMFESTLQQTLIITRNNPLLIAQRPIALGFFLCTIFLIWRVIRGKKNSMQKEKFNLEQSRLKKG